MSDSTDDAELEHIFPEGYFPTKFKATCSVCGKKYSWTRRKRRTAIKNFYISGWARKGCKVFCDKCAALEGEA